MELDFSREWHILGPSEGSGRDDGPAAFAVRELAAILGRMGCRSAAGAVGESERVIVLDGGFGLGASAPGGRRRAPRFSWSASKNRVEILGEDGCALLRGAYDFLDALGARWVGPGEEGERLPRGPNLELAETSRSSEESGTPTTLILGHGAYLEDWEDRLLWAARAGYTSVFVHTTPDALAMGAAPESQYEALRPSIAIHARRLGLTLELGGHGLSSLLPRSLFKKEPGLFREKNGKRIPDGNFCPSSEKALAIASKAFAERAAAHPEVSVFHAWPDDLPEGGWCSCPECSALSAAAQSLKAARALAAALRSSRPDAALAFLAYHDTEDTTSVLEGGEGLPSNLELLWAPRRRSWGSALGDGKNALNTASLSAFRRTARAWRGSGGGRVAVFEYWEDAVLFKGAVPPLTTVIEGDLAAYREADAVGILCTGGRLPLGPRPNVALLPRLAASHRDSASPETAPRAPELLADWAGAAYGPAAGPMVEYWRELEAAWALDLDLEEGETAVHVPDSLSRYAMDPPADWGDPWKASLERLAYKRGRCEELFEHLRRAEAMLSAASAAVAESESPETRTVRGEASEYAISGAILELNCARLAAYHELAAGEPRAAADIANLALSASSAVRKALSSLPDHRARREIGFLVELFYDLRLREIRRANARSSLRRLIDLWYTGARTALVALSVKHAYEDRGIASTPRNR
ncbi:MAG: DUF4838 domain-containing protein [Rectinemataceae bacterium]|jgi:hypothetical protein